MKRLVLTQKGGPLREDTAEVVESPGPGDVLVKVAACGLCATDLKIIDGLLPPGMMPSLPHVLGHEGAGEVVAIGRDVRSVTMGQRVAIFHNISCGQCKNCVRHRNNLCVNLRQLGVHLPGCLREFVVVPEGNVASISDQISTEHAAIISDAIAAAVQAVEVRAEATEGECVLVIGAGGLGLHAIQVALSRGCRVIAVDKVSAKLDFARQIGCEIALNIDTDPVRMRVLELTDGEGVDVITDFVGHSETAWVGLQSLARGGRYIFVGYQPEASIKASIPQLVLEERALLGSRSATIASFRRAVELVNRGIVKPMVTDTVGFQEVNHGLAMLREGAVLGRVVVRIG